MVENVRGVVGKKPVVGICLGHQLLCRAVGLETFKLPFGHRGANHPVKDLETGRIDITSQNHGFAVLGPGGDRTIDGDEPVRWQTDFGEAELSHLNLYDRTVEGLVLKDVPGCTVQYHPEAGPGPHDARYLFDRFLELAAVTAREANLEVLRRWNDTYQRDGADAALEIVPEVFAEEAEFSPLLAREVEGRSYHGHEGIRSFFRELNEILRGVQYETSEYHPVTDEVIVLVTRMTGNPRGTTPISQDLALVYEFQDGRVRRLTAYGSLDDALEAAQELARA